MAGETAGKEGKDSGISGVKTENQDCGAGEIKQETAENGENKRMKNKGWGQWRNAVIVNGKVVGQGTDPAPSKMGNIITIVDGIRFQSKSEGRYATNLNNLVKAGAVKFYLRQVGFDLPGKSRHFVDFLVFYPDGTWKFVEAKGRDLPLGKLKRRQVEEIYDISVEVVK